MLPYLKKKQDVVSVAGPDKMVRAADNEEFDSMEGAMNELYEALRAGNFKGAAQIFKSAVELIDSEPHEEGEHI
jgi:hypothetical protein